MAENVLSNPGRALDLTAKIATAAVSKNSEQTPSTLPELKSNNVLQFWEELVLGKICLFYVI